MISFLSHYRHRVVLLISAQSVIALCCQEYHTAGLKLVKLCRCTFLHVTKRYPSSNHVRLERESKVGIAVFVRRVKFVQVEVTLEFHNLPSL